jgi:hypothetical protein
MNKFSRNILKKLVMISLSFIICLFYLDLNVNITYADDNVDYSNKGSTIDSDGVGGGDPSKDYANWKQYEGDWADRVYVSKSGKYKFGDHVGSANKNKVAGTVADWGCYLVALSIQIARSGSKTEFTPWDFIEYMHNNHYMVKDDEGYDSLVGNDKDGVSGFTNGKFRVHNPSTVNINSTSELKKTIQAALDAGFYPIARINYGNGGYHFVAIDSINGDKITMFDPGSSSTDLLDKYGGKVDQVRVYESDTPSNATGGTSSSSSTSNEDINLAAFQWDEGKIAGMPKPRDWEEEPVPIANYSDLTQSDKDSLEKWKDEVKNQHETDVVTIDRVLTMILGIALMLFSLVYLLAFVFDRITITEFRAMEFITKNRLSVSGTGESTFFRGMGGYPKLINIKDLIILEVLMIGVSVLILNGMVFGIVGWFIDQIVKLINMIV